MEEQKVKETPEAILQLQKNSIFLMSEFYKLIYSMQEVHKTLIIYDLYQKHQEPLLTNLQSISAGILSPSIKIEGQLKVDPDDQDKKFRFHRANIEQILKSKAIEGVNYIKVHKGSKQEEVINIRLYHAVVNEKKIRVVTIPIQKSLTDKKEIENIKAKLKKIEDQDHKASRKFQGEKLKQFLEKCKIKNEALADEYCKSMKQKHLKMFNIEALLYVIRQKTELISVCGMMLATNSNKDYEQELVGLFNVPQQARQFIIHTVTATSENKINEFKSKKGVSCVWTFNNQTVTNIKNQCFSDKYYTKDINKIKTKIYSLMTEGNNEFLAKVIEEFVKSWTNITFNSASCIATIVRKVYQNLQFGDDLSSSFIDSNTSMSVSSKDIKDPNKSLSLGKVPSNESKQALVVYTFDEIFSRYDVKNNENLRQNEPLEQFFNSQRLKDIEIEKGESTIPEQIEALTFLHYFYKINRQFCQNYSTQEKKNHSDLLRYIFKYLKTVYELANVINDSSQQSLNPIKCQDMQTYFNFLDFLFHSSGLIKSITNRQLAICGSLKALFDQLKPRDNRLLTYILSNEQKIKENQPVHYYDLYLRIIKQNSKDVQNKIEYIYVMIHRFKADKIASQYIYVKKKVVQAIKSYSEIIHQYERIAQSKREKINKLDIEKRIARLLLVIGLPDEAVRIYQKNHLVKSAEKCFKQILQNYHGDEKAKAYIEFGKYFESEFSFPKAIDYYESAYETARSTAVRQESIKRKMESYTHMQNPREEEKRPFVRYFNSQGTEEEFLSIPVINDPNSKEHQNQFSRLRNRLKWDDDRGTSVIMEEDSFEEAMIS